MAENKKSFIAYCDWGEIFDELEDVEAGRLVKHLFSYVRDENPEPEDKLTKMMFIQIKQSLKRDLVKYDKYIDKQKVNGSKGGRPKKNPTVKKETQKTQAFIKKPKKADSVNDNVNVNDNVIVNDNIPLKKVTKFSFKDSLLTYGFQKELVEDWLKVRKTKKATNTETAYKSFILEVEKRECNLNDLITFIISKSWSGFKWDWVDKEKSSDKKESNVSRVLTMHDEVLQKLGVNKK